MSREYHENIHEKYVDMSHVDSKSKDGIMNEIEHLLNLRGKRNIVQMFHHEFKKQDNKLFIVLEFGELDIAQYLAKNRQHIDDTTIKFLWKQVSFFERKKINLKIYFYIDQYYLLRW